MFSVSQLPNLITPLPLYGVLLLIVLAWRSRKRVWWFVLVWAYLMSIPALPDYVGGLLENRYPPIEDLGRYQGYPVVMLSSGSKRLDPERGWVNLLANSGWERLLVSVDTARKVGGELFIAGGPASDDRREAISITIGRVIETMGMDVAKISLETESINTYENLANLESRLRGKPFIMVTSAAHLPRAMGIARKLKLKAIPQPADYLSGRVVGFKSFVPMLMAVQHWSPILHELVGIIYYKLKGYL